LQISWQNLPRVKRQNALCYKPWYKLVVLLLPYYPVYGTTNNRTSIFALSMQAAEN
jgi:hypothetical protein